MLRDMKQKLQSLIMVLLLISFAGMAQEPSVLTIEECYARVRTHFPLVKNLSVLEEENALKMENVGNGYRPELLFNAEGKYLSKVIDLNESLPVPGYDIPSPPKDQYNFVVMLNQLIYDGGMIKHSKAVESAKTQTSKQALEVELYQLKARVNSVFFSILFLQYNDSLYDLTIKELEERIVIAESGVENGILVSADLDHLMAEKIHIEQSIIENAHNIQNGLQVLRILIDSILPANVILKRPHITLDYGSSLNRPEIQLFHYQKQLLTQNQQLVSSRRWPRLSGFGQVGYGQPGLNPVNIGFDPYYIIGLRLSWNFWDWNQVRREKEILELAKTKIDNQMDVFEKNISVDLVRELENIRKYGEMMEKDGELILLRRRILSTTSSKLDNGTIPAADYIHDFNQYVSALIKQNIHELFLIQSKYNYLTIKGNTHDTL